MKEFISILISFIFMSIADSIDSAFNNLISIDTIVVTGSFLLIDSIFKSFGEIGILIELQEKMNGSIYGLILYLGC